MQRRALVVTLTLKEVSNKSLRRFLVCTLGDQDRRELYKQMVSIQS